MSVVSVVFELQAQGYTHLRFACPDCRTRLLVIVSALRRRLSRHHIWSMTGAQIGARLCCHNCRRFGLAYLEPIARPRAAKGGPAVAIAAKPDMAT